MKIRTKLILIIISAFVVSFVVQLSFSLYNQNKLTIQEFGEHGKLLAKQISIASLDAMLEQDYYKLIDIIEANKSEASVVNIQIYDGAGKMVASLEADKPGSADAFNGKLPAEIIAQEENGLLVVYAPIIKGLKGVVRLTLSEDWINRQMTLSAVLAAGIALVSLILLSVVCVIVIQRFIIAPINSTVTTIRDITGEKDLRKKISVKSNDEMKVLASCFNDFTATLTEILREIGLLVNKIRKISGNLASSSEESTAALNEIKEHLQIIKEETSDLDNEMTRSNQTSAEVKQFISNVSALISSLAADIAESTASMEEMSSSIQNISNVAKDKLNLANELEETAISGESEMINAVNQIRNVAASADVMQEMTNVINNMAAQTNLLAMNAAIEAAHAGEAGRGFAVVADEIRKLAENAGSSSKEIARSLKQINNYIQVTEESTGKAGELFLKIVEGVKSVADSMTEMNTSTAELAAGSNQIMHSFTSILKTSESVRLSSDTMDEKVSGITGSIDRLSVLSGKLKNGMVEIMAGIEELLKAAGSVLESGNTSVDSITELSDSVSQFRIE